MHRLSWIAAALALACVGTPEALLISYEEAARQAEENSDPDYEAEIGEAWIDPLIDAIAKCKLPEGATPAIVLAVGADGRPANVYVDPPTRENRCLQRYLRYQAQLPKPPFAPYLIKP